jgi:hypothetical protein
LEGAGRARTPGRVLKTGVRRVRNKPAKLEEYPSQGRVTDLNALGLEKGTRKRSLAEFHAERIEDGGAGGYIKISLYLVALSRPAAIV